MATHRVFGWFLVLVSGAALLQGCPKYKVPEVAKKIQQQCIKAVDANQLKKAENYCRLALRYNPKFVEALNGLALVEIRRDDMDKAERLLKKALSIRSTFAQARVNLGHIYYSQRNYSRARRLFKSALDIDPSLRDANYNMARTLVALREYDAAENQLIQMFAFKNNQLYAPAHYLRAYIEFERKQYKYAVPHLIKALRINPRYVKAHHTMCVAMFILGQYGEACKYCRYVLMLDRDHVEGKAWFKKINTQLKKHDKTCPAPSGSM